MSDLNVNRNNFDSLIQDKLRKHEIQPSPDTWTSIEHKLQRKSSARIWFIYSSVASFLLLLSVWFFNPMPNLDPALSNLQDLKLQNSRSTVLNNSTLSENTLSDSEHDALEMSVIEKTDPKDESIDLKLLADTVRQIIEVDVESENQFSSAQPNHTRAEKVVQDTVVEKKIRISDRKNSTLATSSISKEKKPAVGGTFKQSQNLESANVDEKSLLKHPKPRNWGVKAGASTGSMALNTIKQAPPRMMMISNAALLDNIITYIPTQDEFAKRHYAIPISLNVLLSKGLTDRISIETGLSFTSLQTDFSEYKWGNMNASLQLFYMGVPFRLNFLLAKIQHFNIGLSTGMKIEKGLQSVYTQNLYLSGSSHFTQVKESIDGTQLSAQLGADFSYGLSKSFDLYFSPHFEYYPDNNQPLSIRTEMPLQLSLQLGVKYKI